MAVVALLGLLSSRMAGKVHAIKATTVEMRL